MSADEKSKRRWGIFAKEYAVDLNGRRAAIAAGYSAKSAEVRASELLSTPEVAALVDRLLSERASRLEIKGSRLLENLHAMITFDARKLYNDDGSLKEIKDLDYETQLGVSGFETEHIPGKIKGIVTKVRLIRPGERAAAVAILAKYLPDLKENSQRIELSVEQRIHSMSDDQLNARLNELLGITKETIQ